MVEFVKWPSISRLHRDTVVTEKIDGTNSAIVITEDGEFATQSRTRIITPADDNFGFAKWAHGNKNSLIEVLGVGYHYGEWWGSGIQRGYGLPKGERRFSLFNTPRWRDVDLPAELGVYMVPELFIGDFNTETIKNILKDLRLNGSKASPGFANPEGVVIYHTAARAAFKSTFDECDEYGFSGGKTWSA